MAPKKISKSKTVLNSKGSTGKAGSVYMPFARKYRPSDFSELLGQEFLVKTLSYCITENRLAQAYLLSGIRGVGKTSTARIIAKTINCRQPIHKGNNILPCKTCDNCEAIDNFNHPDVVEIDAASHTSIDGIKVIISSSEYMPLLGKYKIFIIDEIHMLSRNAFNALLKIVEEPPEHVIFIFATTEVQKIPVTVISRCQRFDLKRLSFSTIKEMLSSIAKREKINITDSALSIIANNSEGSARDATAILDQAFSCASDSAQDSNEVDDKLVSNMLGKMQLSSIIKLVQFVICNDTKASIELLGQVYIDSASVERFIADTANFMAELLKEKMIAGYHNPLHAPYSKDIANLIMGINVSKLSSLWQIFSNGVKEISSSHDELLTAEMVIIKAIHLCSLPSIDQIIAAEKHINEASINSSASEPGPAISSELADSGHYSSGSDDSDSNNGDSDEISDSGSAGGRAGAVMSSDSNANSKDVDNIWQFLRFCYENNEIEIYYYLLNDTEIKLLSENKMHFISSKSSSNIKPRIRNLLKSWSGQEHEISISQSDKIKSFKEEMIEEVRSSEDFNIIKQKFPMANISDILLT